MALLSPTSTAAGAIFPGRGPLAHPRLRSAVLVTGAVALLAICSQVSFEVPFSSNRAGQPVPITGQTFAVLLIAAALGARLAPTAVGVYLFIGLLGAPVFADAASGAVLFTGATAGYLWGFLIAAFVVGLGADRGLDRGPWLLGLLLLGEVCIYAAGLPVLGLWLDRHDINVSVLQAGLWPFVPGDLAKIAAVCLVLPAAWAMVGRRPSAGRRAQPPA